MQNADTTQFFWGDLVQYISTTTTQKQYLVQVAVEAVLRSISRFESILFLSYFYVISISDCCASKIFWAGKTIRSRQHRYHIAVTLSPSSSLKLARRGSRPQIRIQGLISSNSLQQPPKSSLGCPSFRTQQLPPLPSSRGYIVALCALPSMQCNLF